MADFNNTDVEVPATLTVDGKKYPNVGVHFRGMSSFMTVGAGHKRSMNISLDYVDSKQRLYGYKTLNLLNSHEDPSFMHTLLYLDAARKYIPAPKANFVKLAINGESWGVYVNTQQFNKEFLDDNYPSSKGTRWKVPGSPGGRGGLEYLGEKIADYKGRYEMKTGDSNKAWEELVKLCRVLNKTPLDQLEAELQPIFDLDGALWFLALENALINSDGYWIRASDYCIFRNDKGVFHVIPHDANETFQPGMGPGMGGPGRGGPGGPGGGGQGGGGPGGGNRGPELDPLVGLNDTAKPLRSRLLAVPSLRKKYLENVQTIARDVLDWNKLEPQVRNYEALIDNELQADTRKLSSHAAFKQALANESAPAPAEQQPRRPTMSLKSFVEQRQKFLLNYREPEKSDAAR